MRLDSLIVGCCWYWYPLGTIDIHWLHAFASPKKSKPLCQLLPQGFCWNADRTHALKTRCQKEGFLKDFGSLLHWNARVRESRRSCERIFQLLHVCLVRGVDASSYRRWSRIAQFLLWEMMFTIVFHSFARSEWAAFGMEDGAQNHMDCVPHHISQSEHMHVEVTHFAVKVLVSTHCIEQGEEVSWRRTQRREYQQNVWPTGGRVSAPSSIHTLVLSIT